MASIDVLHVDDDPDARILIELSIGRDPGFALRSCASGDAALAVTAAWAPDLILLDVDMPGMDGPSTLARLRERPTMAGLPVVFLTAAPEAEPLAGLVSAGAAGVIAKPFDPATLPGQLHDAFARSRRRLEEMFRRTDEKAALAVAIIESSDDAIIAKALDGTIMSWNRGAERMFGYAAGDIVGRNIRLLIPPDLLAQEQYIIEQVQGGRTVEHYETVRLHRDGRPVDISLTVSPIRDRAGIIVGASKVARDIGERKRIEAALRISEQRHALAVRGMSVGLWDRDFVAETRFWSDRFKDMLGLPLDFIPSDQDFESRVHPDDRGRMSAALQAHLDRKAPYDVEYRLRRQGGDYIWIHAMGQAAWDEGGRPLRMVGSVDDVTRRKRVEESNRKFTAMLEQQADRLRAANRELDDFAFAAAHDLKAPLRVIDNAAKWLEKDLDAHLGPATRKSMHLLRGRARRMEKLLDDLLQFSRIGRRPEGTDIIAGCALVDDVLALLAPPEGFRVDVGPGFAAIRVNRMPLQQILLNLIGNAIKHHDKAAGAITVTVEDRGAQHVFVVADDGPGIPPQYHDKIFQVFTTLKPRDQVEGSGMGLAIVRRHIEASGGSLALESQEGRGSRFRFTLPAPSPHRGSDT